MFMIKYAIGYNISDNNQMVNQTTAMFIARLQAQAAKCTIWAECQFKMENDVTK